MFKLYDKVTVDRALINEEGHVDFQPDQIYEVVMESDEYGIALEDNQGDAHFLGDWAEFFTKIN
jgi:hypothetical protein